MKHPSFSQMCSKTRSNAREGFYSLCHRGLLFLGLCLLVLGLFRSPTALATELEAQIEVTKSAYRLGSGDELMVQVFYHPDFSQERVLVRSDGYATFNGVGELLVGGKSLEEVSAMLREKVGEYVVKPIVTVSVTKPRPGIVYLAGAVMQPGMFQVSTNPGNGALQGQPGVTRFEMRITNVLAVAGGVTMDADLSNVQIRRGKTNDIEHINLWKVLKGGAGPDDILLQSGDTVMVPKLEKMAMSDEDYEILLRSEIGPRSFPVRLIGQVKNQGVYNMPGISPYLNSAVAQAGGYLLNANRRLVAIRRFTDENHFTTFYVNPNKIDVSRRPNDVVFISEHNVYKSGRFMRAVADMLSPFQSAAAAGFSSAGTFGFGGFDRRLGN